MAAMFLEIRAKKTHKTDAQLDQLHRSVEHEMPWKGTAECRRTNFLIETTWRRRRHSTIGRRRLVFIISFIIIRFKTDE